MRRSATAAVGAGLGLEQHGAARIEIGPLGQLDQPVEVAASQFVANSTRGSARGFS